MSDWDAGDVLALERILRGVVRNSLGASDMPGRTEEPGLSLVLRALDRPDHVASLGCVPAHPPS